MNHDGEERIADRNMQWTMMVRNALQIAICNEPWWSGTHRRSQCAMNDGAQEHITDHNVQWTMVRNIWQINVQWTMAKNIWQINVQWTMARNIWQINVQWTMVTMHIWSAVPIAMQVLSAQPTLNFVFCHHSAVQSMFCQHYHGYSACWVTTIMITMLVLSALTWLPCWFCQH